KPYTKGNNGNIPVSIPELVYGGKAAGVGSSSKSLDRHNELISPSDNVRGPRKDRGCSEGLDTHVLKRKSPTDKILVQKPKNPVRRPEEGVFPRKGEHPSGSSPSLHKLWKGKAQVKQALPTELQNSQEREDSHGQCVQYGKNSDGIQKK
ncbi:hypothetical protein O181_109962, partial [Austropuccinia psidii MF-1]|nr:hypothetical protein [Austropuccinia psidii MF-1]